jgi:short-subunit dehydrogenase
MKAGRARIVLTGASGGIGRAAALQLAQAGAALMLVGRQPAALAAQAAQLGSQVTWQAADLTDPLALERLARAAGAWHANVLVHGAGLPAFGRLENAAPADIQQVLATNLLAPMLLTRALLPALQRQPQAQVICIGSTLGRLGLPGFSVYAATKFGLRGFAEALRRELADSPVQVQYLGPRSTRTDFNDQAVEAYNRATGTAMDPPERVAAALLAQLESEAAESFIGFPETLAVRLNGLAPTWLDGAFDRHRAQLPPATDSALRTSPT